MCFLVVAGLGWGNSCWGQPFDFAFSWGNGGIRQPNGVEVDSAGNLYVSDRLDSRVLKYDSSGTFLAIWGGYGTNPGEFNEPIGMAFDPSGEVYVADRLNHRIQVFDTSGTLLRTWGTFGTADNELERPDDVSVDGSGNVYVLERSQHRVKKYSSAGSFLTKWGSNGTADGQFATPGGIASDSAGNVYVADTFNHRVQKFDASGSFLTKWGSLGTGNGQFNRPNGIALDSVGNVYVTDWENDRIQKFDSSGNFLAKWGSLGTGDGQFDNPYGIAVANTGDFYVFDRLSTRVQRFDASGAFLGKIVRGGDGEFYVPTDEAIDSTGNVYVADSGNDRVQVFDSSGSFLYKWGSSGSGDGQFEQPGALAIDGGYVYVLDAGNERVQKFDLSGSFITKWGSPGAGDGQFNTAKDLAVDSLGNVYVADSQNRRIQKFDATGAFLTKWGNGTIFASTAAIAIDALDNVYVGDSSRRLVKKFDSSGAYLLEWGGTPIAELDDDDIIRLSGIAVDSSGRVYISDNSSKERIQRYTPSGVLLDQWGHFGTGPGEFWGPTSVTVDASGNVYVGDAGNQCVHKFVPETASPTADSLIPSTLGPTTLSSIELAVTFSEAVTGFDDETDLVINHSGTAHTGISVNGGPVAYTVTVHGITGDGSFSIAANPASDVMDLAANALSTSVTSPSVTIDHTAPTLIIGAPSEDAVASGTVSFSVTYGGADSISLSHGDISVSSTGTADGTVSVSGTGTSMRTVTLDSISGDGTIGIGIAADTASDLAGNSASASGPSATFLVDNTPPIVSVGEPSVAGTSGGPVSFAVNFSGADGVTLSEGDVTLTTTDTATGDISVSGSGASSRTVTVNSIAGDGTIGIELAPGTASDAVGNTAVASGPSTTFLVDNTPPVVTVGAPSLAATASGPILFEIAYEGSDSVVLSAEDVSLITTGTASGTIGVAAKGLTTRLVSVNAISGDGTIGIAIPSGTASDTIGNTAAAASSLVSVVVDNTAPEVTVEPVVAAAAAIMLSGTIDDPDASIQVTIGGNTHLATIHGDGTWSILWPEFLSEGTYDIAVLVSDGVGNTSTDDSNNELTVVEDTASMPLSSVVGLSAVAAAVLALGGGLLRRRAQS